MQQDTPESGLLNSSQKNIEGTENNSPSRPTSSNTCNTSLNPEGERIFRMRPNVDYKRLAE